MSALFLNDWDDIISKGNGTAAAGAAPQGAPATPGAALSAVNAADKRIVNGKADINQLAPFKYPWAWEFFLKGNRNHWTPLEISMAQDVHDDHH
ncbi:MAG: ribonucleotide reductase, partial [Rhodocyclales bacterium]|nr:ribonucleotide reductase [Rhodocyclales bacterium]